MSNNDQLPPSTNRANCDEETSLLRSLTAEDERNETASIAKCPRLQLFIICYARLVEPITFFSIFAFISQMVSEVGEVDEADAGFYTGFIVSGLAARGLIEFELTVL